MSKYTASIGFLVCAAALLSVSQVSAALPERLKEHNFNIYRAPCPANDMVLQNVNGGMINLSGLRGKTVILNFWKIDCPPCSAEKAILERIHRKYAGRGLEIIAVNLFDTGDRLKSYCQSGHFSFTFAFDPENRFSVRKENLRSGMPTSFVVNSNSDAIYEIPGVPTTYVINRKGEVVGNSVGMVNWEEQPLAELLESLLGPAAQTVAQKTGDFSSSAGQGVGPAPMNPVAPTPAGPPVPSGQGYPPPTAQAPPPGQAYPPLPFQQQGTPPGMGQPLPVPQFAPPTPGLVPGQPGTKPQITRPAPATPTGKKTPAEKLQRTATPQTKQGTARTSPATATSPGLKAPVAGPSAKKPVGGIPPIAAPAPPAVPSPTQVGGGGSLPPLPPALPYVPGRTQAQSPSLSPDDQGNVMARIPDYGQGQYGAGSVAPGPGGSALPPAQPVSGGNPIGGFILDSFGKLRPAGVQTPPGAQAPPSEVPPSTIFGQLNQDIQALGSGIRDTFSRVLPSR